METQKAVTLIAKILNVLVGNFTPDCGGNFVEYPDVSLSAYEYGIIYCESCEYYHQCKRMTKAQDLNMELQSLLVDKRYMLNAAYTHGFEDADSGGPRSNPYDPETDVSLFEQYARGFFDGAM